MIAEAPLKCRADITAGSLKVAESRVIADLLLKQADDAAWKSAIREENVLQTRSPRTADRIALLIRGRLETMTPDHWKLVRDGSSTVATHACLAAAVKHSSLLADFLELVVGRLDRFGQGMPVQTAVLVSESSRMQKRWFELLDSALGVFHRSIATLQYMIEDALQQDWSEILDSGAEVFAEATKRLGGSEGSVADDRIHHHAA